jgi:succinyl-CoA synthetase beta subunit
MKIHEYQAREIFQRAGIPVCPAEVASTLEEVRQVAERIGYPVVLKSQVLVGGRGKAGGIKIVRNPELLGPTFAQLKGLRIKGYRVERILVAQAVEIKKEYYVGLTIDPAQGDVVLIASAAGGVEIEEIAKTHPELIHKLYLQGQKEIDPSRLKEFLTAVFQEPELVAQSQKIFQALVQVFFQADCSLAEINPLIIDSAGRFLAIDAKINFDDNALIRHPDYETLRDMDYEDEDELEANRNELSFVKMEGDVGCIVNGAGLAMATLDVTKLLGGKPANFLDVGGSSRPEKVLNALKIILRNKKVKVILVNIFGGITRCDDIARGILEATKQMDLRVPLVVRLTGTNEEEARKILEPTQIHAHTSMREAVKQAVELARGQDS